MRKHRKHLTGGSEMSKKYKFPQEITITDNESGQERTYILSSLDSIIKIWLKHYPISMFKTNHACGKISRIMIKDLQSQGGVK